MGSVGIFIHSQKEEDKILEDADDAADENGDYVTSLCRGQGFGEVALMSTTPRTATIVCEEDCCFLVLDREQYQYVLKEGAIDLSQMDRVSEFIENHYPFTMFDKASRISMRYIMKEHTLPSGTVVIKEGAEAQSVFFIYKGECELSMPMTQEDGNLADVVISTIGAGECFGEYELVQANFEERVKRQITVHTKTHCVMFEMPKNFFVRFFRRGFLRRFRKLANQKHNSRIRRCKERLQLPQAPRGRRGSLNSIDLESRDVDLNVRSRGSYPAATPAGVGLSVDQLLSARGTSGMSSMTSWSSRKVGNIVTAATTRYIRDTNRRGSLGRDAKATPQSRLPVIGNSPRIIQERSILRSLGSSKSGTPRLGPRLLDLPMRPNRPGKPGTSLTPGASPLTFRRHLQVPMTRRGSYS